MFPTKNQLLQNFSSCTSWEEKYMYIIDLGKFLPKFPERFRTTKYLITGCQSHTWIALTLNRTTTTTNNYNNIIRFYGDSDAAIVKGIIVIIFSLYQNLDIDSIINLNAKCFLDKLQLNKNLTVTRSQGVYSILKTIRNQTSNFHL